MIFESGLDYYGMIRPTTGVQWNWIQLVYQLVSKFQTARQHQISDEQ